MDEIKDSGVVDKVFDKGKFQTVSFRGKKEDGKTMWFSNWGNNLKENDIINFTYTIKPGEKGNFYNIKSYNIVNKSESTLKEYTSALQYDESNTIKQNETAQIKSKIKEITISRGQKIQFSQYEPTDFHVSFKAEFDESDDIEKVCAILTECVETELLRQILNERERRK